MALTTYNITGNLEDALGAKATLGEVTFMPAGTTQDARVDGADAMLGPIRYSLADLPSPMPLTEGAWVITFRSTGRVNGEAQFRTKTIPWNMTAATTWGAIVASAADPVPLPAPTFDESVAGVLGTGGQTDTALKETIVSESKARRVPADSFRGWGHSYIRGTGPTGVFANVNDMSTMGAETLGLPLRNEAISGTALFAHNSAACNFANVLQKTGTVPRWARPGGLHVTMWGINDVAELGNTVAELLPFEMAYRVVIARLRAGRVFEQDDPTVALAGATWSTATSTAYNSGPNIAFTATVGATITVTTPEDFPGGTVTLGFSAYTADGGTVTGTFAGTTYTLNTNAIAGMGRVQAQGARTAQCLRIPNVPAGVNTITLTQTATVGPVGIMFDYWSWEPPEDDCPLVVLVKQPHPVDYTQYVGPEVMPTDAGMDAINTILDRLAAEFGERVITVDTSVMNNSETYFDAGDVHPNVAGHAKFAELIAAAVRDRINPAPAPQREAGREEYRQSVPAVADRNYVKGDIVWNTLPAPGGYIGWVCTADGAPGTWKGFGAIAV